MFLFVGLLLLFPFRLTVFHSLPYLSIQSIAAQLLKSAKYSLVATCRDMMVTVFTGTPNLATRASESLYFDLWFFILPIFDSHSIFHTSYLFLNCPILFQIISPTVF